MSFFEHTRLWEHFESQINGFGQPGVSGTFTPDAYNQLLTDASAFSITIDSGQQNVIRWLTAKHHLLAGTSGSEYKISGKSGKGITPFCYDVKQQTVWGSKDMQPLVLHEAVVFVDYVGKKLREMLWDGTDEKYISPDLLQLAEHITKSGGITTMAYQKNPDSIIWATLANGDLISCTYDREQECAAWARHPLFLGSATETEDEYEPSVSTDYPLLYGTDDQADPQLQHLIPVSTPEELQNMNTNRTGHYYLTNDIDASDTINWNSGDGFTPIGEYTTYASYAELANRFRGTFDGCGYTISNLYINLSTGWNSSLFGCISQGCKIANVTLENVNITGDDYFCGALVSQAMGTGESGLDDILIQNCHASGTITSGTGMGYFGGLIGHITRMTGESSGTVYVYDCSSSVELDMSNATTYNYRGGFIGYCIRGVIKNCYATGNLNDGDSGDEEIGGFGGRISYSDVSFCYATGNVEGIGSIGGGFAGRIGDGTTVDSCYATGDISGDLTLGGFGGQIEPGDVIKVDCYITDCYAWGNVVATGSIAGGFAGASAVTGANYGNCYCIGTVTGTSTSVGGFIGDGHASTGEEACYWDTETSGLSTTDNVGEGQITTWMKTKSNYESAGWDFDTIWYMAGNLPWTDISIGLGANSVCVIPGDTEDEVWISVGRYINSALVRYVERMKPRYWGTDQEDCFFVDSGLTYDGAAATTFTGLDHLEGETVAILGDGAVFPNQVVNGGSITLGEAVSVCHVGLPFTYKLKPMRMDQNTGHGTSKGSIKKIAEAVISFYESLNANYSDGTDVRKINFRTTEEYTTPPDLLTGDKVVVADGGFSVEDPFQIEGSEPLPCTVRAIIPRIDIVGR